ncbi:carbon monoxide dehydrogenase subunit G [Streptomyces sp. V4-01]|uniref:Carbon monoxide dehydrogenase subunit G n=1 Tax=Actinacidiphila polyblastidii TaxID=3110430 RepID=A0ABU7PFD9_9ACTN|nr:carbon monoxide dehydrogenase subunit G [Streptomyces sp. V4-01]
MEHESFVPIPPARLTHALRSAATVTASLPGWQPDDPAGTGTETPADDVGAAAAGDAGPDSGSDHASGSAPGSSPQGRLRLRVGGSTITYRATLKVSGDASPFTLEAHGEEVRGTGTATVALEVRVEAAATPEPGTNLVFRGSGTATGRVTGYDDAVVEAALRRLLDRFSAGLAERAPQEPDVVDDLGEPAPPAGVDDFELVEVEVEVPESAAALDDLVTPAEAAHARRTMIGRSAEEVDHAPPRGRYAPVPAPDASSAAATLRWAAPAAAALLASAVVVGRVLRRRR